MGSSTQYKPNYFLKDFDSLRTDLITRVPILSNDKLTDLNESSITVTLIELFASMGDMLGFYLESNALEGFLPTVRQPENVYRHAKTIGYRVREITSAKAKVQFKATNPVGHAVTILEGTRISTSAGGGINQQSVFVTDARTTIPPNETLSDIIGCTQGTLHTDSFQTDGSASQKFKLSITGVDPSTVVLGVGSSKWEYRDTFLYSTREDTIFTTETNYLGVTWVILGDGKYGAIPDSGDIISATYLKSSGDKGNVNAGAISLILDKVKNSENHDIDPSFLTVTNSDPSAGGSDRQSLEQVKTNAPGSLSALYRAMTKYDYIALIQRLGGVQHVNVWGEQEEVPNNANWEEYMNWANVVLGPVGVGGQQPSNNLTDSVREYLESVQPITVRLRFIPPEYRTFNISATVSTYENYHATDIKIQAQKAIEDYLDYKNVRFGLDLRTSTIYAIIMGIPGVSHVVVDDFAEVNSIGISGSITAGQEVILKKWEIPLLNTVALTMEHAVEEPVPDLYPHEQN